MADKKISDFTETVIPELTGFVPFVDRSTNYKISLGTIVNQVTSAIGVDSADWSEVAVFVQSGSFAAAMEQATDLRSLSSTWQETYTTVQSNSADWASNPDTDLRSLSSTWQETYTTFKNVSSTFLTAETDSQTLTFNESTKDLSISNGNTVSLSSLSENIGIDSDVRSISGNWESTYTTVQSNSANWENAYTTVQSNSSQWALSVDTNVRTLTSNWESTYTTFKNVSSTFLTAETDSQTLTFNESTKDLSISNGNTVSLTALANLTAVDTEVRPLTGRWESAYTTVQSNSANWEDKTSLSTVIDYLSTNNIVLSSAQIGMQTGTSTLFVEDQKIGINTEEPNHALTVVGNISSTGVYYGDGSNLTGITTGDTEATTLVRANSANWEDKTSLSTVIDYLSTNNVYISSAQIGMQTGTSTLFIRSQQIGINTEEPNHALTVVGNISSTGVYYGDGSNLTGITTGDAEATTLVRANSANWNYQGTDLKDLSGNWQKTYTTVQSNSSAYLQCSTGYEWRTTRFAGLTSIQPTYKITYGGGLFLVAAEGSFTGEGVATSPDGINWTNRTIILNDNCNWSTSTYGNGLFVVLGYGNAPDNSRVAISNDGIKWRTIRSTVAESAAWSDVTYGNGIFVAVTSTAPRVMYSYDGIKWSAGLNVPAYDWSNITYGNGLFVALANGAAMTSSDGINWTLGQIPSSNNWTCATYGNGLFVAVASNGSNRVMTSSDGVVWTAGNIDSFKTWSKVEYGNGLFVAVAFGAGFNQIATSADGFIWSYPLFSLPEPFFGLAYGNGSFVGMGYGTGNILISGKQQTKDITNSTTYVNTAGVTTPGISAITTIVAVSALPATQDPGTLYILI